jgi:hypothetical protein
LSPRIIAKTRYGDAKSFYRSGDAITVFGSEKGSEIALIIAMGYIIQVQSAAWYVKLTDKTFGVPVMEAQLE